MTYIVGARLDRAAYLVADTVLTTPGSGWSPREPYSSFDELHLADTEHVAERALKIFKIGGAGIAFAGDWNRGQFFAEQVNAQYALTGSAIAAFLSVAHATVADIEAALVTFDGEPRLLTFNRGGTSAVEEHRTDCIVQLGSGAALNNTKTATLMQPLAALRGRPDALLVSLVGCLQNYGVHEHVLRQRFGGAFCGMYVDETGPHWQGETLYGLYGRELENTDLIAAYVRDNVFVVCSAITQTAHAFASTLTATWPDNRGDWERHASERIRDPHYGFVVLISKERRTVCVIDMKREISTQWLRISPPAEKTPLEIQVSSAVYDAATSAQREQQPGTEVFEFHWFPFDGAALEFTPS